MSTPRVKAPRGGRRGAAAKAASKTTLAAHSDALTQTAGPGLANTRTRIVGAREGLLADAVINVVRLAALLGAAAGRIGARIAAVVTPLGWVMLGVIPLSFVAGYVLGWTELALVAWAGLVLALIAVLYLVGRSPFHVVLALAHRRVVRVARQSSHTRRRRTAAVRCEVAPHATQRTYRRILIFRIL